MDNMEIANGIFTVHVSMHIVATWRPLSTCPTTVPHLRFASPHASSAAPPGPRSFRPSHFILSPRLVKTEQLPTSMKTPYFSHLGPSSAMPGQSAPAFAMWLAMPSGAAYVSDMM